MDLSSQYTIHQRLTKLLSQLIAEDRCARLMTVAFRAP